MSFEFTSGPHVTQKSIQQVGAAVQEVGQEMRFMGMMRRHGIKSSIRQGNTTYAPFTPRPNDDPFGTAADRQPDWRVGWQWHTTVTIGTGGEMSWRVIFDVYDDGATRRVIAKVQGSNERKEIQRFVDSVFQLL